MSSYQPCVGKFYGWSLVKSYWSIDSGLKTKSRQPLIKDCRQLLCSLLMTRLEFSYEALWQVGTCTETILIMSICDCYHWMVTAQLYLPKEFLAIRRKNYIINGGTVT